ncbi:hypothetical protein BGX20_006948, partial [Mortierella sp. AD010]
PERELSLLHLARELSRVKKVASNIRRHLRDMVDYSMLERLAELRTKFNEHAEWVEEATGKHIERLEAMPSHEDQDNSWQAWIKGVKQRWTETSNTLQAIRQAEKAVAINEAIEKRCGLLLEAPGKMLDKVLGRSRGRVILDRIQEDQNGFTINIDEPVKLKETADRWFTRWHGPRPAKPIEPESRWEQQYKPQEWIQEEWYNGLMDPPSQEEFDFVIKNSPKFKAPGISGITNDMIKNHGPIGRYILFQIVGATIVQKNVPDEWKTGMLYCIPKAAEWSGNMAEVRPITLLEHARKIMFAILTN